MKYRPDLAKIKRNDDLGIWELSYDGKVVSSSYNYENLQDNKKAIVCLYKKMLYLTTVKTLCNDLIN